MAIVNYRYNLNSGKTYSYQNQTEVTTGSATSAGSAGSASSAGYSSSVGSVSTTYKYETVIVDQGSAGATGSTGSVGSVSIGSVGDLNFNQLVNNFTNGDLVVSEFIAGLKAKGATSISSEVANGLTTVTFTYNSKKYQITCNTTASASQIDTNVQNTFTLSTLQNSTWQFSNAQIEKYFVASQSIDGNVSSYTINPSTGFKTLTDVKNAILKEFETYKNDLILDNFLDNKNRSADTALDLRKTQDNTTLLRTNYDAYVTEIGLATDYDAVALRNEALSKVVTDYTSGNLAIAQVRTILNAIGITSVTESETNGLKTYSFEYEGKNYTISCNKDAAVKGSDDVTQGQYTKDQLQERYYFLSDSDITTYFNTTTSVDGNSVTYTINKTKEKEFNQIVKEEAESVMLEVYGELPTSFENFAQEFTQFYQTEFGQEIDKEDGALLENEDIFNYKGQIHLIKSYINELFNEYSKNIPVEAQGTSSDTYFNGKLHKINANLDSAINSLNNTLRVRNSVNNYEELNSDTQTRITKFFITDDKTEFYKTVNTKEITSENRELILATIELAVSNPDEFNITPDIMQFLINKHHQISSNESDHVGNDYNNATIELYITYAYGCETPTQVANNTITINLNGTDVSINKQEVIYSPFVKDASEIFKLPEKLVNVLAAQVYIGPNSDIDNIKEFMKLATRFQSVDSATLEELCADESINDLITLMTVSQDVETDLSTYLAYIKSAKTDLNYISEVLGNKETLTLINEKLAEVLPSSNEQLTIENFNKIVAEVLEKEPQDINVSLIGNIIYNQLLSIISGTDDTRVNAQLQIQLENYSFADIFGGKFSVSIEDVGSDTVPATITIAQIQKSTTRRGLSQSNSSCQFDFQSPLQKWIDKKVVEYTTPNGRLNTEALVNDLKSVKDFCENVQYFAPIVGTGLGAIGGLGIGIFCSGGLGVGASTLKFAKLGYKVGDVVSELAEEMRFATNLTIAAVKVLDIGLQQFVYEDEDVTFSEALRCIVDCFAVGDKYLKTYFADSNNPVVKSLKNIFNPGKFLKGSILNMIQKVCPEKFPKKLVDALWGKDATQKSVVEFLLEKVKSGDLKNLSVDLMISILSSTGKFSDRQLNSLSKDWIKDGGDFLQALLDQGLISDDSDTDEKITYGEQGKTVPVSTQTKTVVNDDGTTTVTVTTNEHKYIYDENGNLVNSEITRTKTTSITKRLDGTTVTCTTYSDQPGYMEVDVHAQTDVPLTIDDYAMNWNSTSDMFTSLYAQFNFSFDTAWRISQAINQLPSIYDEKYWYKNDDGTPVTDKNGNPISSTLIYEKDLENVVKENAEILKQLLNEGTTTFTNNKGETIQLDYNFETGDITQKIIKSSDIEDPDEEGDKTRLSLIMNANTLANAYLDFIQNSPEVDEKLKYECMVAKAKYGTAGVEFAQLWNRYIGSEQSVDLFINCLDMLMASSVGSGIIDTMRKGLANGTYTLVLLKDHYGNSAGISYRKTNEIYYDAISNNNQAMAEAMANGDLEAMAELDRQYHATIAEMYGETDWSYYHDQLYEDAFDFLNYGSQADFSLYPQDADENTQVTDNVTSSNVANEQENYPEAFYTRLGYKLGSFCDAIHSGQSLRDAAEDSGYSISSNAETHHYAYGTVTIPSYLDAIEGIWRSFNTHCSKYDVDGILKYIYKL